MADTSKDLDFRKLSSLAKAASDDVRQKAIEAGTALPVWRDGRVVYIDPKDGSVIEPQVDPCEDLEPLQAEYDTSV
ncbi:MAG: hypothetical protein IIB62_08155 [Proteobacteria bacterium]|nr:hypothetical protein [Pseudomonadota bacterium]